MQKEIETKAEKELSAALTEKLFNGAHRGAGALVQIQLFYFLFYFWYFYMILHH
jgi:hypothetical protein